MSINLEQFLDKDVAVQLRPGMHWMVIRADGEAARVDVKGDGGMVAVPFLEGKVVAGGQRLRVQTGGKRYIEVALHPDSIAAVSMVGEPCVLTPSGSILMPS